MALAILRFQDSKAGKSRFQVELGANRFYRYAIGSSEVMQVNGLPLLQDPIYTSALLGPLPESSLGRTLLEVPNHQFDRQHRSIQITSFRAADQVGPAISQIVQVLDISSDAGSLPAISFGLETEEDPDMEKQPIETVAFQYHEVSPVSEAMFLGSLIGAATKGIGMIANTVSKAVPAISKVIPAITKAAPAVLNQVAQVAPTVIGAVTGSSPAAGDTNVLNTLAGAIGGLLPKLTSGTADGNEIATLLMQLLQQIGGGTSPTSTTADPAAPPPPPPPAPPPRATANRAAGIKAKPIMNRAPRVEQKTTVTPSLAFSVQDYYPNRAYSSNAYGFATALEDDDDDPATDRQAYADGLTFQLEGELEERYPTSDENALGNTFSAEYSDSFSEAHESMLLPLAEHLAEMGSRLPSFTPQLLSEFGTQLGGQFDQLLSPENQMAGQMSAALGIDAADEAGEDKAMLIALSLAMAASTTADLVFQRLSSVTLAFNDVTPLMLQGKSRFLYRQDQDISLPLKLETPQPIRKARLQVLVKHPKTLKILIEQNYSIESAASGPISVVPKLSKEQLKSLSVNEEYLITVALVWQGRSKKTGQVMKLGTNTMQLITLVGEYLFDRIEGTGATIPLNDVDRFRPYWHKVWQGDFSQNLLQMNFECKYYYTLENNRTENARMETVTQITDKDISSQKSRLKSGLIVSPYGLNNLLGQLSSHPPAAQTATYPRLSDAELAALATSEFKSRFSHAARTGVEFMGDPGETVALWVYPELKMQQVFLKKVDQTHTTGNVLALKEHPVYFPMPAIAHFIGVSTKV